LVGILSPMSVDAPPTERRGLEERARPSIAALEALYGRYHPDVFSLAYRLLGNGPEAEDVVQDVFIAIWRSGHTYNPSRGTVRTWLLAIAHHRAIDLLRDRPRLPTCSFAEDVHAAEQGDVSAAVTRALDRQLIRQALQRLPPEQREVVELAYFRGLTHQEIATRLRMPLGTVKGRLRLAMTRLRKALGVAELPCAVTRPAPSGAAGTRCRRRR
jgi:RNA polymerase sigma-70 factor, ECF subfamily